MSIPQHIQMIMNSVLAVKSEEFLIPGVLSLYCFEM